MLLLTLSDPNYNQLLQLAKFPGAAPVSQDKLTVRVAPALVPLAA